MFKDGKKCKTEFNFVPVYANSWLVICESLIINPEVFTMKILDMKNRRTITVIKNQIEIPQQIKSNRKLRSKGVDKLYYLG